MFPHGSSGTADGEVGALVQALKRSAITNKTGKNFRVFIFTSPQ
jgi:hypothetical protein